MKTKHVMVSVTLLSLFLSACGGGGGGSSTAGSTTPEVPKVCANGGKDYPTCTPPITPANLQLTVPEPIWAPNSELRQAYDKLNSIRRSMGLGLLAYSPELTLAAEKHALYLVTNTEGGFKEDPTKPEFYGVTGWDRAKRAGYPVDNGAIGGGLAPSSTALAGLVTLMNTIYHRIDIINQSYTDFGQAIYVFPSDPLMCHCLLAVYGRKSALGQNNASDFVTTYPVDGQTRVFRTMQNEIPNPFPIEFPNIDFQETVGSPVTFVVAKGKTLILKSFTITAAGDTQPTDAYILTAENDPNKLIPPHEVYLVAKTRLKRNTMYQAHVIAKVDGKLIEKKWSFTTIDADRMSIDQLY